MKLSTLVVNMLALAFATEAVMAATPTNSSPMGADRTQSGSDQKRLTNPAEKPRQLDKSVLDDAPPASPKLTNLIRSREGASATGLRGTALLMALLKEKGLSINDRSWIESRLNELKSAGDLQGSLLTPTFPPVLFVYTGLKQQFQAGEHISIRVEAAVDGKTIPLRCSLADAEVTTIGKAVQIKWTATSPTVQLLTCNANGHSERRLIKVFNSQRSR